MVRHATVACPKTGRLATLNRQIRIYDAEFARDTRGAGELKNRSANRLKPSGVVSATNWSNLTDGEPDCCHRAVRRKAPGQFSDSLSGTARNSRSPHPA